MALDLQSFRLEFRGGVAVKKILIVDDIPAARDSLASKLNLYHYTTVLVGSVDEALQRLAASCPRETRSSHRRRSR